MNGPTRSGNALNLIAAAAALMAAAGNEVAHLRAVTGSPTPLEDGALCDELAAVSNAAEAVARTMLERVKDGRAS